MNIITRKRINYLFLLLACFGKAQGQVSFGQVEKIDNDWSFLRVDSTTNSFESPKMKDAAFDDSRWRRLSLPHDWSVETPMSPDKGSCQAYLTGGIGWYRKHLTIDKKAAETEGIRHYVYFEGVYNYSEVYVNGKFLGLRPSGFASFLYDITPYLSDNGDNIIAVRVNHSQEYDSRWYTGSGIYRHVWLVKAPEVHLSQWGTAYRLVNINKSKAVIEVDVETTDDRADKTQALTQKAVIELTDASGNVVASTQTTIGAQEKKTVTLTVKNPQRWTLEKPYLYSLTTKLPNDKSVVKAGLRTLEFSADKGFALNGQWMKIKGVCLHDDAGVLGTAVPKAVWERRLKELKAIGVNAIRMSHNP
ncbi:MAG: beta galactosidase jelly roll domain-containing protein, partial [Prevotella sp.]|nr:beta galactosidase jelly roll domain-containing protein [Prevotella sp.]